MTTKINTPCRRKTNAKQTSQTGKSKGIPVRRDLYREVTDKIIGLLEKGVVPWKKPWKTLLTGEGDVPRNYVSKKAYRGMNLWLLIGNEYERPYYMTFNQALKLGGNVKKGAKGHWVVFWKMMEGKNEKEEIKTVPLLRYDVVFNIAEIEGIPFDFPPIRTNEQKRNGSGMISTCEIIINGYKGSPEIIFNNPEEACYYPTLDTVNMPTIEAFKTTEQYYKVFFHELAHSTGHYTRLNRDLMGIKFGERYNKEELIAEMTGALLCGAAGLNMNEDSSLTASSAGYLAMYIKLLRDDKRMIFTASTQAQKAANLILGVQETELEITE
ncbi:MAG: ssDNA-binding domain-containing protein [Rudanella sp.]|nr:ssDNA-binding domain-containing protein [Rudanella sp.]